MFSFGWTPHSAGNAQPAAAEVGQWEPDEYLAKAVTGLAVLASMVIALAFPAAWFVSVNNRLMGVMEVGAQIYADHVADAASQSPELWNAFFGHRAVNLEGLAIAAPDPPNSPDPPERRQILSGTGDLLLDVTPALPLEWPIVSRRAPVVQNGNRLGSVVLFRSLHQQIVGTLGVALVSFATGFLLLTVLRVVPLRLMRQALDRASYLAAHDQLTGLPNRTVFLDRLEQALSLWQRGGETIALLYLDLDRFKEVNDTMGHAAGDALLQEVTVRLRRCLRESDTLARLGGDEFAVIQIGVREPLAAEALATRLIRTVHDPIILDGQPVFVGLSIGIALSEPDSVGTELARQADLALYRAKETGRGRCCFFAPEMNARLQHRRAMESDLRAALAAEEFVLYYQPQVDVASFRVIGTEALIRWERPGHGLVPPNQFIPIAEDTGLIVPMGAWLLRTACKEASDWPTPIRIAVNVSPVQFRYAGFLETVRDALAVTGLHPNRLELEVTEGVLLNDTEETLAILSELRSLGVRLAMDDFGTGYASLGYLQKFRFDKIKIDRTFINTLGVDPNAAAIVRAVVGLSDALGMSTNAEGVENERQIALLRAHGCQEAQGFLFWPPLPADSLREVMQRQTHRLQPA